MGFEGRILALSYQDQGGLRPWKDDDMTASWLGLKKLRLAHASCEPAVQRMSLLEGVWLRAEAGWNVTSLALSMCLQLSFIHGKRP